MRKAWKIIGAFLMASFGGGVACSFIPNKIAAIIFAGVWSAFWTAVFIVPEFDR